MKEKDFDELVLTLDCLNDPQIHKLIYRLNMLLYENKPVESGLNKPLSQEELELIVSLFK